MAKNRLRLCYICFDANSWHLKNWTQYFIEKGHEIHIISPTDGEIKGAIVHRSVSYGTDKFIHTILGIPNTISLIKQIKPHIVHALGARSGFVPSLIRFTPFVVTGFGSDILLRTKESILKKLAVKYILKHAHLITGDSKVMFNEVINISGNNSFKMILFGVNKRRFNLGVKDNELKSELGVCGQKVVLSPRSMIKNSNIDIIIRSIPIVLAEIPDVVFVFKYNFGDIENEMKTLAKSLGVAERTRFIGYIGEYDKLPSFYKMSDVTVSILSSDSSGCAWFESIACGAPLILSDIANSREWFENENNAVIVPLRNVEMTAKAIIKILSDKQFAKNLVENAAPLIEVDADYYKNMEKMEKIYYDLANTYHVF